VTHRIGGHVFSGFGGVPAGFFAGALLLAVAGCTTGSINDIAPASSTGTQSAVATDQFPPAPGAEPPDPLNRPAMGGDLSDEIAARNASTGPADTGQYPNLNIIPGAAAPQLSQDEIAAKKAALKARRQAVVDAAPDKPKVNAAKLRKLAADHAKDALNEIEGD
jgi:hypothetical protein